MAPPEVAPACRQAPVPCRRAGLAVQARNRCSDVVLAARDLGDFIERDAFFAVILEKLVVEFGVVADRALDQILVDILLDKARDLHVLLRDDTGRAAADRIDVDDLAGVGADDRAVVEVIEALAGGRAHTLCAPLLLGHDRRPWT